jgi:hypothetical protein
MNFDDHDWEADELSARDRPGRSSTWQVAAGVAIGIVVGASLMHLVDRYPVWRDTGRIVSPLQALTRRADPVAEVQKPAAQDPPQGSVAAAPLPDLERQPPGAGPARAAHASQPSAPDQAERQALAAQRAAQQALERKERAWALYYTKPAQCDSNPPRATMVECANHFIRAKRQFEELYAAGQARPSRRPASSGGSGSGP